MAFNSWIVPFVADREIGQLKKRLKVLEERAGEDSE
jgi:hypothetical protein